MKQTLLKNNRQHGFQFRTKLILTIEIIVITITILCGFLVYNHTQDLVREVLRNKLIATASTAASIINSSQIQTLQAERDIQSQNYVELKEILKKTVASDSDIDSVYIMEKSDNENILKFLVDSMTTADADENGVIDDEEKEAEIGEEYDITPFPEMQKAFSEKTADYETSCDKWGCWLSGYAPILGEEGETLAIVGVDISANQIAAHEKKLKLSLFLIFGTILIFFPAFLFFYLRNSLKPISEIANDITKFSGDLSTRIDMERKDEFGLIADNFNKMADELSDLVKNMETKVVQRTEKIAQQKKQIEADKNKTESILKSIGDGVFVVDTNFEITMFNKTSESITGFSAHEALGRKYYEIVQFFSDSDETKKNDSFIIEAIGTGKIQEMPPHTLLINKFGQKIPVADSASPIKDEHGKVIGCVVVFRDIAHEYEIDKAKTEFVSLASHQLRTPLSSINWYAEMLLAGDAGKVNANQKSYLKEIYYGNQRMIELVNSLLNVSRLEMGTFLVEPKQTDILKMADEVIKELTPRSLEKEIKIKNNYDKTLPEINVDPKLMRIIFQNLLSNSIKYTQPKGKIELKIGYDEKNLNIEVTDNGMGIPESQKANIFSKFFRADNVRQTDAEGTGLGLYLLKSIIDHSEGKISFTSTEGQGTTFFISIPLTGMKAKKGTKEINEVIILTY
ncbi:MAG: Multi-sensor signal transduction histidine kinase [Candidatus Moranbacteria bacterium GW2011_GWF2_35_54]|nr:MAG: Multi-sensor signal transduction histidine kinase [Candidatus Moranbacteria bacterium GW2011_GWF2_35_54]